MALRDPIERRITRCAIYTRKSTEHGLDAAVNSLEMQRDVCQAYIKCQAHRNWTELSQRYDDGGFSGGTLVRPALERLIRDIEDGRVDVVIVYKIDRLTRSLLDFVRLTDVLEKYGTMFVSVTQAFDTTDSMGRLVLNVLLTFAQFERELASDRVRDKKAALRKKGLFVGGLPPFGYVVAKGGKLELDEERAPIVTWLFEQYPQSSIEQLVTALRERGCTTRKWMTKKGIVRGGQPITARVVSRILADPIYAGFFIHRGDRIEAQSQPLVSRKLWDEAQATRMRRRITRDPDRDFLLGILHDEFGRRMNIADATPGSGRRARFYRGLRRGVARDRNKTVSAEADHLELLAKSALKAFFLNDQELRHAILSLGAYSTYVARLLKRGRVAAGRLDLMDRPHLRRLFLALVPRAEITKSELKLYISSFELTRYLAWDGAGLFSKAPLGSHRHEDRVHLLVSSADVVKGKRHYALPLQACHAVGNRKQWLIDLLLKGAELRAFVLANRDGR